MTVRIAGDAVIVGRHQIGAQDFIDLVQRHLNRVPGTQDIEDYGERVQAGDRPEDDWKELVRQVVVWGRRSAFRSLAGYEYE